MQRDHTHTFSFAHALASARSVDIPVLSLDHTGPAVEKVFAESLKAVEEDAARAIILGCTGFIGVAQQVQNRLEEAGKKIPVIDPNCAAVSYLILLIRNKLIQSRMAYHFRPLKD
jgi:Asp/Glu/hydantoin racemase